MVDGRVGVTISPLELCAVHPSPSGARDVLWRAPLEPCPADSLSWPSLAAALRELSRTLGANDGTLSIALMPPLAEVRTLDVPALRDDELRSLVSRNAQRYFTAARGSQLVAVSSPKKRGGGAVLAAAAPARLVAAIHSAARDAGWRIHSIIPVESAWGAAARALWPALSSRPGGILVLQQDRTDLILLRDGRIATVRRFRPGAADARRIADAVSANGEHARIAQLGIAGTSDGRKDLVAALSGLGITTAGVSAQQADSVAQHDRLAAAYAGRASDLQLRTDDARVVQHDLARRTATWIGAAAVVLLLLAGVFELWGIQRQLRDVQSQRAALKPQLSSTLVGRTSVETVNRQLATLNSAERTSPQWTTFFVNIADHLNDAAYLTSFKGRGDSVVVEGIAAHAAQVFEDLEQTPGLAAVRAAAPVRREAPNGADATQRFTIAARLAPEPVTAPARRGTR